MNGIKEFLSQNGVELKERDFFKQPFTVPELRALLGGQSPASLFNTASPTFKASGLDRTKLTDQEMLGLMVKEPRYIKRPVVVMNGKLLIGASAKKLAAELGD